MGAEGPEPLDDEQLRSIIANEIQGAVNHATSEIASDQEDAIKYYEGRPFGNEVAGSSSVVLRDVAETVDWAMPALMRAFFYTAEVAEYQSTSPEGEPYAKIATKVVNEIYRQHLRGFRVTHDWAKAGLLEMFATVKFWIEQVREPQIESHAGLSPDQLTMLLMTPDTEVLAATEREQPILDAANQPVGTLQVYDVRVKTWKSFPRMRLETVPPEEFLCSRRATRLDQSIDFVAHQKRLKRSELLSLGIPWDLVSKLPTATSRTFTDGRATTRFAGEDQGLFTASARADIASQEVTVTESYVLVDYDGDGYSERRRVLTGGDNAELMLEHDYAAQHGFAGWTPIPMPHKLYGRGYFNVVADLQRIRSTLARQLLDNIVRMNNARHKIIAGEVDIDSYLDTEPAAPVLVERMESIESLDVPALPSWAFDALSYFEKVREQRTGIHPYSQDVYAAGQNQTAQGVSQVFEAAMAQIQLLAQMLGEGLADLFRLIPRAMKAAGMGPGQIKVGEEWIPYDPQEWPDDMRVSVQVGLSPGQTEQKIQRLLMLLGTQKELMERLGDGFMVTKEQIFGTLVRVVEQCGFINPGAFFTSPQGKEMPPQPPDPKQIEAETNARDAQSQRALELAKLEFDKEKERNQTARLEREALRQDERERLQIEAQERTQRYAADRQFEAAQLQAQATREKTEAATKKRITLDRDEKGSVRGGTVEGG